MPVRELTFLPASAVESLLYLVTKLEKPTLHELLKLRYFADKIHLSKYGQLASGDNYVAMKFGPVGSQTYDLLKAAAGEQSNWINPDFVDAVSGALSVESNTVSAKRAPDLAKISSADRESLDEAVERYGHMRFGERTQVSHDAAWQAAYDAAQKESRGREKMPLRSIVQTLPNADEVLEHLYS